MVRPGAARNQLAEALNAAYGAGLLSENTLVHRLDLLFSSRVIDPVRVVGDIGRRMIRPDLFSRLRQWLAEALLDLGISRDRPPAPSTLLALDWSGSQAELLLGRHSRCDVMLSDLSVSRLHARLLFRDGSWIVQDLGSTNGTAVNGVFVGRCKLHPGDDLLVGDQRLRVD